MHPLMSTKRDTPCRPVMSMLCAALLLTTPTGRDRPNAEGFKLRHTWHSNYSELFASSVEAVGI